MLTIDLLPPGLLDTAFREDARVGFAAGEEMRTEIAAKFRRDGVDRELAACGLHARAWWTDPPGQFAVSLSVPV